jgi:hypothetical protein
VELKEFKGHLDKHYTFLDLERPSQLNIYADAKAKCFIQYLIDEHSQHEPSPCKKTIFKEG